ncbi:glycosyltransferase family 2 protein [Dactylosporangium sp. NPDC006015]|uniref:glycosyltransferase family 2 protein n=1 Tax=Dactylosporangium sp. NPDC006015 TaxID=3154576 RepID=UPI0033B7BC53
MHPLGLTAVVPCYDEADSVAQTHAEIVAALGGYDLEILFVDDGSGDGTLEEIQRLAAADDRVHYLSFSRNFGFEAAFSAGYKYARKPWLVHLDADLQFPPTEVHLLVERALEGFDAVFGVRRTRHDPWHRRWGAACYHWLGRRLRIRIPPGATTFRVLRTELARRVVGLRLGTPYFLATVPLLTSRIATVPVEHRERTRGTSKFRLGRLIGHALELYVAFSRRAVHWVAIVLLLAALVTAGLSATAFAGWVGVAPAIGGALLAECVALAGAAVMLRYTVLVADAQPRPAMFYIREASIPVDAADELFPGARAVPHIPVQRGDAA